MKITIGTVVILDRSTKRYLVVGLERSYAAGADPSVPYLANICALSGGFSGSGRQVEVSRLYVAADQTIAFSGVDAEARRAAAIRYLAGIGMASARYGFTTREHVCSVAVKCGGEIRVIGGSILIGA
jgi:hypothetical protein